MYDSRVCRRQVATTYEGQLDPMRYSTRDQTVKYAKGPGFESPRITAGEPETPRAQFLKKSKWLLHIIGDKVPPAARDSSEAAHASSWHFY